MTSIELSMKNIGFWLWVSKSTIGFLHLILPSDDSIAYDFSLYFFCYKFVLFLARNFFFYVPVWPFIKKETIIFSKCTFFYLALHFNYFAKLVDSCVSN